MVINFGSKNIPKLASKVTTRTHYSAHQSNNMRGMVEPHDQSQRAQLSFSLSNANSGQKLLKFLITKDLVEKLAVMTVNSCKADKFG